jgi:hypothetical protein
MLRTSTVSKAVFLCLLAHAGSTFAQQPSSAPPKLERIEEGSDTPITVTSKPKAEQKVTEKKEQGKVTEVHVQSGKSKYVMKPNTPAGAALPGDGLSAKVRAPQWQVMEFDIGKKKQKEKEEEAAASTPAPPPPPVAK